jgi:hypothetical protein
MIRIHRSLHVARPAGGGNAWVTGVGYVSRDHDILMLSLSVAGESHLLRSEDNGGTWAQVERWVPEEPLAEGLLLGRSLPEFFVDPQTGWALRYFGTSQSKPGVIAWDYARAPGPRTRRIYTQISRDEGRTWSEPQQLIESGGEYDQTHWMAGVWYGKNGFGLDGGVPVRSPESLIIAPGYGPKLVGEDIINPAIAPEYSNPDGNVEWTSACLLGLWREDGSGLDWTAGERVTLPRNYSCDGADEPSLAYLPDGRLLMILRARTYPHTGQELPSLHYVCTSSDDGRTWSPGEPLLYDDGSCAYSPSCLANVSRSRKNDRVYVITNLADGPCVNCDPRTKLQIAEIDIATLTIKRDTVTIIEEQPPELGETPQTRFSNFRWFEDRRSGDLVLYLTPGGTGQGPAPDWEMIGQSYRYDIELPGGGA